MKVLQERSLIAFKKLAKRLAFTLTLLSFILTINEVKSFFSRNFKAKLVPTDDITIFYEASGDLERVCRELKDFILDTIKQPLVTPIPSDAGPALIQESNKVCMRIYL